MWIFTYHANPDCTTKALMDLMAFFLAGLNSGSSHWWLSHRDSHPKQPWWTLLGLGTKETLERARSPTGLLTVSLAWRLVEGSCWHKRCWEWASTAGKLLVKGVVHYIYYCIIYIIYIYIKWSWMFDESSSEWLCTWWLTFLQMVWN